MMAMGVELIQQRKKGYKKGRKGNGANDRHEERRKK
jgi:hypothetical protein